MFVVSSYAIIFCYLIHQAISTLLHIGLLVRPSDEKTIARKYFTRRLKCQPTLIHNKLTTLHIIIIIIIIIITFISEHYSTSTTVRTQTHYIARCS